MSASETAEAILLVIKRLAKWIALSILVLALVGLAGWGAVWVYQYFDYERPRAKIEVVVFNDKCDDKEYPIFVGVVNRSDRTILSYSFRFEVNEKGRSSNLAAWDTHDDDKVIKPGEGWGNCWRIKKRDSAYNKPEWITDRTLEVSVVDFRPRFK